MGHRPVDLRVASSALFIVKRPWIADARQDNPVLDSRGLVLMTREPGDRSNCAGNEQEPVRIPPALAFGQFLRQEDRHADARKVVIAQRGMAHMTGKQDFVSSGARKKVLPIGQSALSER